jgi:SOS-response transcriptional repressor LexA
MLLPPLKLVHQQKQSNANNGDIVIAMTDEDEATCKRFFREVDHIRLQPENDALAPILLDNVTMAIYLLTSKKGSRSTE